MNVKLEELNEMISLFGEIYELVNLKCSSYHYAQEGLRRRHRESTVYLREDFIEHQKAKWIYTYPVIAATYKHELAGKVERAYQLWLKFREEIDEELRRAGLAWSDIDQALSVLAAASKIEDLLSSSEGMRAIQASSIAMAKAQFNLTSIPITLGVIAPIINPENSHTYIEEAEKAYKIIAIAHLRKTIEKSSIGFSSTEAHEIHDKLKAIKEAINNMKSALRHTHP